MVLVDTSVWIRGLAGREPYRSELDSLLAGDEVAAHHLVYGELLVGDRGGRARFFLNYDRMRRAVTVPHREVVAFVRDQDLTGRGVGWVDIHLLASAIVEGMDLWTADPRFSALAAELGTGYRLRHSH